MKRLKNKRLYGFDGRVFETDDIKDIINNVDFNIKIIGNLTNSLLINSKIIFIKYLKDKIIDYGKKVFIYSGCSLKKAGDYFYSKSCSNFALLEGIPGTIGGSIYGNASFLNSAISDTIIEVLIYDFINKSYSLIKKNDCNFTYRNSIFKSNNCFIIGAYFQKKSESLEIINLLKISSKVIREVKQPQNIVTLGSTFKNGNYGTVSSLLEDLNIKGLKFLHTSIDIKHVNFLNITDTNSTHEINFLINLIKEIFYKKYKIYPDVEIEII